MGWCVFSPIGVFQFFAHCFYFYFLILSDIIKIRKIHKSGIISNQIVSHFKGTRKRKLLGNKALRWIEPVKSLDYTKSGSISSIQVHFKRVPHIATSFEFGWQLSTRELSHAWILMGYTSTRQEEERGKLGTHSTGAWLKSTLPMLMMPRKWWPGVGSLT